MYKILLINTRGPLARLDLRQIPGGRRETNDGKYCFYINEDVEDPDFVFVRGKALRQKMTFNISPRNLVLLTSEPYTVLSYPKKYCRQFGLVCSCQENLRLPNVTYTQAILPWFVGMSFDKTGLKVNLTYDDFQKQTSFPKTKLLSVITSDKAFTRGHQDRIAFVDKLKTYFGDRIDVFGRGIHEFSDKWDVLAPYKYHVAIENSSSPYYWTEKISDCFLAHTFPFYYGAPNLCDFFPDKSFLSIDIYNPDRAIQLIESAIAEDIYANRVENLERSRELVLEDYNMFNVIIRICDQLGNEGRRQQITLRPARSFFDLHNFYLHTFQRTGFKVLQQIRSR